MSREYKAMRTKQKASIVDRRSGLSYCFFYDAGINFGVRNIAVYKDQKASFMCSQMLQNLRQGR